MKLDASGLEDLSAEFESMASDQLTKLEREAVKEGAKIVQKEQQENWNRSTNDDEHIEDAIIIGRTFENDEGTGINVGPKMSLRWRAKFVEYGTSRQPPQAPVRKSEEQAGGAAMNEMMRVLERVVK